MKFLLLLSVCFCSLLLLAQNNGVRQIEPGQETSFEKYEVLIIAVIGLLLLIGLRFWFKRTRNR
jgi:hypothetical protein